MWPCVISQNIVSSDDTVELAYMYTDNPARYKLKPRPFHLPCTLERTLLFFLLVFGLFFLKCSLTLPNTTPCSKHRSDVTQFQAFNTSFGWSASTIIIKLMFTPWKIKNLFSAKDAISKLSRFRVVYINLLAQAVVPVMLARQNDILPHVFVNIPVVVLRVPVYPPSSPFSRWLPTKVREKMTSQPLTPRFTSSMRLKCPPPELPHLILTLKR